MRRRFSADDSKDADDIRAAVLFALLTGVVSLHSVLQADAFGDINSPVLWSILTEVAGAITGLSLTR